MSSAILGRDDFIKFRCDGEEPTYPIRTSAVVEELWTRGLEATAVRLAYYVKTGRITPGKDRGRNLRWYPADIDDAANVLAEEKLFTPLGHTLRILGIDHAQYLHALKTAGESLGKRFPMSEFASTSLPNSDCFVMHVNPPRTYRDGLVTFTPCDDVVRALEERFGIEENISESESFSTSESESESESRTEENGG